MLSTALNRLFVCLSLALVSTVVLSKDSQAVLSCDTKIGERGALKQAPMGARRVGKHVLEIASKKGPQRFVDTPPHDLGDMDGIHWRYCGYDIQAKAHLIEMRDEGTFSGILLFDETGERVRAGHTVSFSPNRKEFLGVEQENGVDGENWTVYNTSGKTLWKGYAGTIARVDSIDTVVATFAQPRWTKEGELAARLFCGSSKMQRIVTLVRSQSGNWSWGGHENCP